MREYLLRNITCRCRFGKSGMDRSKVVGVQGPDHDSGHPLTRRKLCLQPNGGRIVITDPGWAFGQVRYLLLVIPLISPCFQIATDFVVAQDSICITELSEIFFVFVCRWSNIVDRWNVLQNRWQGNLRNSWSRLMWSLWTILKVITLTNGTKISSKIDASAKILQFLSTFWFRFNILHVSDNV